MDKLAAKIEAEIGNRGAISFARFMELALYCPVCGYYEKEGDNIGRRGDYYTSVSVGALFGQLLACQFGEWFAQLTRLGALDRKLYLVEVGAHGGELARDVLSWFRDQEPDSFRQLVYWVVDRSPARRQWQQRTLNAFAERIRWVANLTELPLSESEGPVLPFTIIFSNELLDALPVHRLGWDRSHRRWFEWGVGVENGRFCWVRMQPDRAIASSPDSAYCSAKDPFERLHQWLCALTVRASGDELNSAGASAVDALLEVLPDGFSLEVSTAAEQWWRQAAELLSNGKLLTIDYGHTFEEFLRPEWKSGTLRSYRHHTAVENVLEYPGQQDITADVNFTALQRAGEAGGLQTDLFLTQPQFLTAIAARIWNNQVNFGPWTADCTRQFQTLTHPEHLGRSFNVLVQSRTPAQLSTGDCNS